MVGVESTPFGRSSVKRKASGCCVAFGCGMRMGTNLLSEVKLFKFPKDPERRKQWEVAVHRENWNASNSSQLCNLHFISGKPSKDPLHPDYVPSVFSFKRGKPSSVDRYERHTKRLKTDASYSEECNASYVHIPESDSSVTASDVHIPEADSSFVVKTKEISTMTELTMEDLKKLEGNNEGYKSLTNVLHKSAKRSLSSRILNNVKMLDFYTKLPTLAFFNGLLSHLLTDWKPVSKTALDPAGQFLLVLMKLRLGLWNQDLAYRFGIGSGTVSSLFREWLARMAFVLSSYITQPSRETIKLTMPRSFFRAGLQDVCCIIDCSEIFIDRPFNLDARAQTYSNYKHHNTIKFLIACTPCGGISFISKAYGGRLTDKEITKQSGFLDTVKEKDVILADRGFRIEDLVSQRNARVIVPAFTKGMKQLPPGSIMSSRKISRVRIKVEQCIGQMKTYGIMQYQWPITFLNDKWMATNTKLSTADNILTVVAALCNISRNGIAKNVKTYFDDSI